MTNFAQQLLVPKDAANIAVVLIGSKHRILYLDGIRPPDVIYAISSVSVPDVIEDLPISLGNLVTG